MSKETLYVGAMPEESRSAGPENRVEAGLDGHSLSDKERYRRFVRPGLVEKLEALELDKVYHKGEGNHLFHLDRDGSERKVLDLVGGYGSAFFGHNHPDLVTEAILGYTDKTPFLAQGSIKPKTALLAERLSGLVRASTGREYVVTLANTGAEVVEAAIKHAVMERQEVIDALQSRTRESTFKIRRRAESQDGNGSLDLSRLAAELGLDRDAPWREVLDAVDRFNAAGAEAQPVFLALKHSFHGKTVAAVNLTYNENFRSPFMNLGFGAVFLGQRIEDWHGALRDHALSWLEPEMSIDGAVTFRRRGLTRIAGLFVEPIQGEGGINCLDPRWVAWISELPDRAFPIIVDEIQSGMGRTGKFLASEHFGLKGDYYCIGKSLGGGIAKAGALLVERTRFVREFSLIHTSTFAEDEISSSICLKALEILTDERHRPMLQAERKGAYFMEMLGKLKERHPKVIKEIRGKGLMIGVEFHRFTSSQTWLMRGADEHDYLGYLVAGFMLNEGGIRIFPTLSSPNTLRIEPSYLIGFHEIDATLSCLAQVCEVLAKSDLFFLTKHMLDFQVGQEGLEPRDFSGIRVSRDASDAVPRVAFLGHFIRPEHLKDRDQSLAGYPDSLMGEYFAKTYRLFPRASFMEHCHVTSASGAVVALDFVGMYLSSEVIYNAIKSRDYRWVRNQVVDAVREAKDKGCVAAGLGGFTSIVTNNCLDVDVAGINLTTGNALTVAMGVEAVYRIVREKGLDLEASTLGVVGALGNISSIYAQIIAERAGSLALFGTETSGKKLKRLAMKILMQAAEALMRLPEKEWKGVALSLSRRPDLFQACAAALGNWQSTAAGYDDLDARFGLSRIIAVHTDLSGLRRCPVIVTATNSPAPILFPHHLGESGHIILDIAVPRDTHPDLEREKPRCKVILGGVVRLPRNPDFKIGGIPLPRGRSFACMAETLLMGLEGMRSHYSIGDITKEQVSLILEIAGRHGFALAEEKLEASF